MRRIACLLPLCAFVVAAGLAVASEIAAIAYHDIVAQPNGDPYAITVQDLERQMAYLQKAGYQPISLRQLEDARQGRASLPPKPVLLTFDDGYQSYYERAYPVLQRYGFPSVVSIVTSWIDRRSSPEYAAPMMTWDEVREIARSPLVEVLSHSDDLHRFVPADPHGARRPAAVARIYDATARVYETDAAHRRRIKADLARSVSRIKAELGRAPRGVTWPYGEYEQALVEAAAELGMRYHLTLDVEPARLGDWPRVNRQTFRDYRTLADLGNVLTFRDYRKQQLRFVEFDLAPLAARDAAERARLIAAMARRAEVLRVDAVVVRPFTADGKRAYFPNSVVPVAAELLSQVSYQLAHRAGVRQLYLSIPATADRRVYTDLARRHWFTGVALEGTPSPALFEQVTKVLRRYKPTLKLGIRARQAPAGVSANFVLVDVAVSEPAAALESQARQVLANAPRAVFLLQRAATTTDAPLRAAMASLRAAGARHYGYGPDDYINGAPVLTAIVRALTEHTVLPRSR